MRNLKAAIALVLIIAGKTAFAQFSSPQWENSYGGSMYEFAKEVVPTSDGGFITVGYSESADGNVAMNHGAGDCWVVKFNSNGTIQWEHTYGGAGFDYGYSIVQTTDGGYVATGYTESFDGDITFNQGGGDCWVLKLDPLGNIQWQKTYGGSLNDNGQSIKQTPDGGYVVAANTESNNGDVSGSYGSEDCWILKLNALGTLEWQKVLGGSDYDFAQNVEVSALGDYYVCGGTHSNDHDVALQKGNGDCWAVKLNIYGVIQWEHSFGGSAYDFAQDIELTADGNFVMAGFTESSDGDVVGSHGGGDTWALKFDAAGNILWQNPLGSNGSDYAYSIHQNSNGTYVISGYSEESNGDVLGNHGSYDVWMVMLTGAGDLSYQKSLGGSGLDIGYSVCELNGGGYVVAGYTQSDDGDVAVSHGSGDSWVLKLNATYMGINDEPNPLIAVSPNPGTGMFRIKGLSDQTSVEVFDIAGKRIFYGMTENEFLNVDLTNEAKGVYIFKIREGDTKINIEKIVLN